VLELADTIHHELRHVEGNVNNNNRDFVQMRRILDGVGDAAERMKLPRASIDPRLRMGDEVHDGLDVHRDDPYSETFRKQAARQQVIGQLRSSSNDSFHGLADKLEKLPE
jgi:hypothetical protein